MDAGFVVLVAAILAHHPTWTGLGLVLIPILVIAVALAIVKRRVDAIEFDPSGETESGGTEPGATAPSETLDDGTGRSIRR